MNYVDELRHLDDVTDGLAVSENAYMTTTILRAAKPLTQVVYSDVPEAIRQQQNLFNNLCVITSYSIHYTKLYE